MAELLKDVYDRDYVTKVGMAIKAEYKAFPVEDYVKDVFNAQWKELELKERMACIRAGIHTHLKTDYAKSLDILEKAGREFGGFAGMLFPDFVEKYGHEHWQRSLKALEVLTTYSSSEFAIRPFLMADPKKGMAQMLKWSKHKNEHVRRLASEGCRPRLPWAGALKFLKEDPSLILPILENLKSDPSLYVRKSVANNLNDISKDHPKVVLKVAKSWLKDASVETKWIVKHALRTLLKAGEPQALRLFGYGGPEVFSDVSFFIKTPLVLLNERLKTEIHFSLKKKVVVRLEYALHFLLKNGTWGRKVFKISEKEMTKGDYSVEREHLFKLMTTRKLNPGAHAFELILNGHSFGILPFFYWQQSSPYQVYMLETERGTLYSGVTTDMNRRFLEHIGHVKGGAKFTRAQKPRALVYVEEAANRSEAQKKESGLKKLKRQQKLELISHSFMSSNS